MKILTTLSRYFKWGGSWVAIVPPIIREHLCLRPGDVLIWHLVGRYAVIERFAKTDSPFRNEQDVKRALEQPPVGA